MSQSKKETPLASLLFDDVEKLTTTKTTGSNCVGTIRMC